MMNFYPVTLFPEMVSQALSYSITGRAMREGKISLHTVNIRDFSQDRHHRVDDAPFGGGCGMLLQAQPIYDAWRYAKEQCKKADGKPAEDETPVRTLYVTPQGRPFTQALAEELAKEENLILLCGHYEGIDERAVVEIAPEEVSIGDYVLTGGELAAMVIMDAVSRLVPGVLHNASSAAYETFENGMLEYPQYTHPRIWHGQEVPEVLLSGNEKEIRAWRQARSLQRTKENRPDLYAAYEALLDCRKTLMRQKLLHIDMISLIDNGRANLLYRNGETILLSDQKSGILFLTVPSLADEEGEEDTTDEVMRQLFSEDLADIGRSAETVIVHQKACAVWMSLHLPYETEYVCRNCVCTRKEMLPTSGLYMTNGEPMPDGPLCGMQIRPVREEEEPLISSAYHLPHTKSYLLQRIRSGEMFGAYFSDELAGFIGFHAEGSIGMLEVLPPYRGRHIAMALETFMANRCIREGRIPYGDVIVGNEASVSLQEKMGNFFSPTPVYWMRKNEALFFGKEYGNL